MNEKLECENCAAELENLPICQTPVGEPHAAQSGPATHAAPEGFVYIPGGTFMMGSPEGEPDRLKAERQHEVTVSGFYMGKFSVTQEEYEAVRGSNPSKFRGAALSVEQVSWYDAAAYCNKRSEREGLTPAYTIDGENVTWDKSANGYRLPTEAE